MSFEPAPALPQKATLETSDRTKKTEYRPDSTWFEIKKTAIEAVLKVSGGF
jgi:hypothetical protein